jgi:hypothetical protein
MLAGWLGVNNLGLIYIGKVCWQNHQHFGGAKPPALLALATLGSTTQIGLILFVSLGQSK